VPVWPGRHRAHVRHCAIACAPKLARTLKTPDDLAKVTLLHPVHSPALWSDALAHLGVADTAVHDGMQFHDAAMMRRAAMPADRVPGFYLVVPRSRRRLKAVVAFCDWITGEDW
jgi:LysR family transcriptional regulator, glycine cleavage system transcriptional activator